MEISEIKRELTTKFIGQNIHLHQKIDSTNEEGIRQSESRIPEGTLILTEFQTAGRGKNGRSWLAPVNSSILGSIVLYPKIDYQRQGIITLLTAIAVVRSIYAMTGLKAEIKWPNDVLISNKKVCGILTETGLMDSVIVGFGINVNITEESMPESIRKTATSIQIALGYEVSRTELMCNFLVNFEKLYFLLKAGKQERILDELRNISSTVGKQVNIMQGERTIRGKVLTIQDDGALLIQKKYGALEEIYTGEII